MIFGICSIEILIYWMCCYFLGALALLLLVYYDCVKDNEGDRVSSGKEILCWCLDGGVIREIGGIVRLCRNRGPGICGKICLERFRGIDDGV